MPRGKLNEKTVQRIAVNWLTFYYASKLDLISITSEFEAVVSSKSKLGYGRADGLIAAMLSDNKIFTASIEAKSSRTLHNILPNYLDEKWVLHTILAGLTIYILFLALGWTLTIHWFWKWIFPLIMFVVAGTIFVLLTFDHKRYRPIDVVSQAKRYPGDEQWIALSTDAYVQLTHEKTTSLLKDCRREGIGLLRISTKQKVTILQPPRRNTTPKSQKDFLDCYTKGQILRRRLEELQIKHTLSEND